MPKFGSQMIFILLQYLKMPRAFHLEDVNALDVSALLNGTSITAKIACGPVSVPAFPPRHMDALVVATDLCFDRLFRAAS